MRTVAIIQLLLVFPAVLFMTALCIDLRHGFTQSPSSKRCR
jgi:hypothetical protein